MDADLFVDADRCTGCEICVPSCPVSAIRIADGRAMIGVQCTSCGICVSSCPSGALRLPDLGLTGVGSKPRRACGIWVYAEHQGGELGRAVLEIVGRARELSEASSGPVWAVLLGHRVESLIPPLIHHGAHKVLYVGHPLLEEYSEDVHCHVLESLVKKYEPLVFLFGASIRGRTLAPRVAVRLKTGLTADCTSLDIDVEKGLLLQTRPAFGGNVMATIICPETVPQMATVRPGAFKVPVPDYSKDLAVVRETVDLSDFVVRAKVLEVVRESRETVNLDTADVIVAGGAGVGGPRGFRMVEKLAELLGGCVGASRAAVDAGWAPRDIQIGQTGKSVSPRVYIAIGISGAVQHVVGIQNSGTIIAINDDGDAPIFQTADLCVVGDLFEIVPRMISSLETASTEFRGGSSSPLAGRRPTHQG